MAYIVRYRRTYYGPFPTAEAAAAWANVFYTTGGGEWFVIPLRAPPI